MSPSQTNWPFVINVGNSIIGVTVLAMPFCFQACGILLGMLLLFFSTWLTIKSCQLLMKAGVTSRRRCFSLLAHYTHGVSGKLLVEVGMIGLQLGTLIAQVVIIGDLGPDIVSRFLGIPNSNNLRTGLIIFLCLFVGLPLGLLKDIRTLSRTSTLCILFYTFFTFYVVLLSIPNLVKGDWYSKVNFWRTEGFFQCLPIFSFAFGCQTQLFIVYDALADPSLKRMNSIVGSAVHMCTVSYLLVGFFGYIAFCNAGDLSGDIINHFREDTICGVIKICFVFSIAVSIPLIVFPCRVSLYTLCFPQKPKEDVPGSGKIPELHFKVITAIIIVGSMIIGILIPNIEFVLGLNGATMGCLICYIFPALFFLAVMSDKSEGLFTARLVLAFGLIIMVASTYTILRTPVADTKVELDVAKPKVDVTELAQAKDLIEGIKRDDALLTNKSKLNGKLEGEEKRQEPPVPQAPLEPDLEGKDKKNSVVEVPKDKEEVLENKVNQEKNEVKDQAAKGDMSKDKENQIQVEIDNRNNKVKSEGKEQNVEEQAEKKIDNGKLEDTEKRQEEILAKLEQQQQQQEKLIQEQKEILNQLKEHNDQHKKEDLGGEKQLPVAVGNEQNLIVQPQKKLGNGDDNAQQPVQNFEQQVDKGLAQQAQPADLKQGVFSKELKLEQEPARNIEIKADNVPKQQDDSLGRNIDVKLEDQGQKLQGEQKVLLNDNAALKSLDKDKLLDKNPIKMTLSLLKKVEANEPGGQGINDNNNNLNQPNLDLIRDEIAGGFVKNKEIIGGEENVDQMKHRGKRDTVTSKQISEENIAGQQKLAGNVADGQNLAGNVAGQQNLAENAPGQQNPAEQQSIQGNNTEQQNAKDKLLDQKEVIVADQTNSTKGENKHGLQSLVKDVNISSDKKPSKDISNQDNNPRNPQEHPVENIQRDLLNVKNFSERDILSKLSKDSFLNAIENLKYSEQKR